MLKSYKKDGLELVIDELSGEVYASQKATARMCKVSEAAIHKFKGANQLTSKMAEVLTPGGLQGANLFNEGTLLKLIAHYNSELLMEFAQLGMRLTLQRAVNFEMSSHSVMAEVDKVVEKMREQHKPAHNSMQAATTVLKVASDTLAMTCVQAVTGCAYTDVMDGVEYRTKYSPDVLPEPQLESLTKLKHQFVNMKLTSSEKLLNGRDRCIALVRRACVKVGVECLV